MNTNPKQENNQYGKSPVGNNDYYLQALECK